MTDYLALRRHVQAEHPPGTGLSLYLRNDVLAERHAALCDWTARAEARPTTTTGESQ